MLGQDCLQKLPAGVDTSGKPPAEEAREGPRIQLAGFAMTQVLERVPHAESARLRELMKPFREAGDFVRDNFDSLLNAYADEWIAVSDNQVIAHSPTRSDLKAQIMECGLLGSPLYITFLTRQRRTLIL